MLNLYFENLYGGDALDLEEQLARGIMPFDRYLNKLIKTIKNTSRTISWKKIPSTDDQIKDSKSIRIHLVDQNGSESNINDFLDDKLKTVIDGLYIKNGKINKSEIAILNRSKNEEMLELERIPINDKISIRPNLYVVRAQSNAIKSIKYEQLSTYEPIMKLFYPRRYVIWPTVKEHTIDQWFVLKDEHREGAEEQRKFVQKALGTQDFAFLEGPPGSGKTTVLCELIAQLTSQGKRVLLCASTHVAVDNVLERIIDRKTKRPMGGIIPMRIGNREDIPDIVKSWGSDKFCKTKKQEILNFLSTIQSKTKSQKLFLDLLKQKDDCNFDKIIRSCVNLICGTTIGILSYFKDTQSSTNLDTQFDVLIIDEASKTTFTEFLVPALHAKRWIIVGDIRQLPPYIDDKKDIPNVIETYIQNESIKNACVDIFYANNHKYKSVIITNDNEIKDSYVNQCEEQNIRLVDLDTIDNTTHTYSKEFNDLQCADIIIGSEESLLKNIRDIPYDITKVRGAGENLDKLIRRITAFSNEKRIKTGTWGEEISWRMKLNHEANLIKDSKHNDNKITYQDQIECLLPQTEDRDKIKNQLDDVALTTLPSFLEFIQHGFKRERSDYNKTVISNGMSEDAFNERHIQLRYQYRMHNEIADFSHRHIYNKELLYTPKHMKNERAWEYTKYSYRTVWINIQSSSITESNIDEANAIIDELDDFCTKIGTKSDGTPWKVAILTFYRKQENTIRLQLRKYMNDYRSIRYFKIKSSNSQNIEVELCTVDRFQGQEADIVFISMVKQRDTSFLRNPNRLNVAITRARYQCVIVGNQEGFKHRKGILSIFAKETKSMWKNTIKKGVK